ncbi:MAG: cob(I)yrinic acid a,c-diamide adenosyltransferase [bacterium]
MTGGGVKGYVQVYTGDGKGKTTAALGLALRAVGAGLKVFIGQFVKGMKYAELESLARFRGEIEIRQYGRDCFIHTDPDAEDIRLAREGLQEMQAIMASGEYPLVILDEANIATYFRLFSVDELLQAVAGRADSVEVVITGRKADPAVIDMADLVTEMKEVKHYYTKGVQARDGIEK